jgi:glycerophosphoryl diester phosphodiesterase
MKPAPRGQQAKAAGTRPLVIAHRGGAALAPENTIAAFRRALELGVDGVELDVRLSRDGHPVVIHDATVDRTMEGCGRVCDLSLGALQALRARGGGGGGGGGVPALREVLALVRGRARLYLEVKADDGEARRAIEEKALAAVAEAGPETEVTFVSFDLLCLRRLRELSRTIPLGVLVSRDFFEAHGRAAPEHLLDEARGLQAQRIAVHHELATPDLLEAVRAAGLSADVWTVNDAPAIRRFALLGVDAITTDRPDLFRQILPQLPADAPTP